MSKIKRYFVEKKEGLDYEAASILKDIHESLGIKSVKNVRLLHRYDVEGVREEHLRLAESTVVSEPPVDNLYEESFPLKEGEQYFVTEYLPGQFDQCADSLVQCLQIISGVYEASAAYAKVYVLEGDLTEAEVRKIEEICHNPVDSRIGAKEKPETLAMAAASPEDVGIVELIDKTDSEIEALRREGGYAMSVDDLMFCREYFKNEEKRNPTVTEIKVIDTYWSDHCRHTTFLTELEDVAIEDGFYAAPIKAAYGAYLSERDALYKDKSRPVTLMDIAVIGMKALKARGLLDDLDVSDEINACSIEIEVNAGGEPQKWLLMFKNETHNHPTEIEPYGGAATCLGGAIRDPLSGRAYVYQAMRITGAGDPRTPVSQTLPGKLPQKKITLEAAHGYSSYGNQIGLATGHVREIYDEGFVAKRMEIGAVIGAAPKENVNRQKPEKGDVVIIVGGRTGRDGCGGATGSSKEHGLDSLNTCGAEVQKGNAPTERKLQRLFRNREAARLIKKCNDFGAGGVCVAIGELSDSISIKLDNVTKKYEGLDGTELAISESQERMAVVVSAENAEAFISYAREENLEAVIAADITDDGYMKMFWRGKEIVSLKRSFLDTNGARQTASAIIKAPEAVSPEQEQYNGNPKETLFNIMGSLNACSQKGLIERFDATIGSRTVLMPFGGKKQLTPEDVMAAKIPVPNGDTDTVSVMSAAYDPDIFKCSPFHGGVCSVVESVARLVAAGCDYKKARLSFQEYFERMTDSYSWGKPAAALLGAFSAQMGLNVPAIGGKDSMSGTFGELNVPPVLTSFAVSVTSAQRVKSAAFSGGEDSTYVYALLPEYDEYGIPDFESLKQKYECFYNIEGKIISAAAVKKFGIAETAAKMCFGNGAGMTFDKDFLERYGESHLFKALYGAIVFEAGELIEDGFAELLGTANSSGIIDINGTEICTAELAAAWEKPLESIFPTRTVVSSDLSVYNDTEKQERGGRRTGLRLARPKVFIPVFPGTNCEYDSENAFALAGADVETLVFRNTGEGDIQSSVKKMAECIRRAQIVMIPGGFSAGDEPNGSAKFISAVFRNPFIAEAINEHIKNKDGLILGICNGFQALVKLGLLPGGEISDIDAKSPTIYYNEIGRHVSQIVDIKIVSNKSPFLAGYDIGEIYRVPVSHGEGRFLIEEKKFSELLANGQIATVYAGEDGNAASERPFNPNGSMYAVEGVTSPDGRIFGRMGHPERSGKHTFKNVPGEYDRKIFEAAVDYFVK